MPNIFDEIISSQTTVPEDEEVMTDDEGDELAAEGSVTDVLRSVCALHLLSEAGISLSELMDDVFLGNESVRNARPIINARREAFANGVLPRIVARVYRPPDMQIQGKAHQKAAQELKEWANTTTSNILRKELAIHAKSTKVGDCKFESSRHDCLVVLAPSRMIQLDCAM
ncbi:unnamed protein product [Rhizoctonia solani]|nr:unnamed protein product [Rhizoctonia solani]